MEKPQTKQFAGILSNLKLNDKKIMFVQPEHNSEVELSIRNLPAVLGVMLSDINTYDIMNSDVLVLSESAAKIFSEEETAQA
jgi:large subunit ribosomal protein L4